MNNELAEWIVKAIETIKSGVVDELVKYLEDLKSKAEATKELREENELLKNSDSLCKLIGEQKLKITDLENKLANADYQLEGRDIKIKDLEKENAELKADFIKSCKVKEQGFREAEQALERKDEHLTKAKEFIKKFSEFVNNGIEYDPEHPQEHTDLWNKLCAEAEQFLNCSEKPNN